VKPAWSDITKRVRDTVARVPAGQVATYGQIARESGLGRRARVVGRVLRSLPTGTGIPWHRVVNARGQISLPEASDAAREQRRRLESEGVMFRDGRIDLGEFGWRPSLDELLWGPPDS
jgi:methylated-DNA-protein-cysteine methyltransferase-like protein